MQYYTTIVGVIELRSQKCSYDTVQKRYSIGSGTVTLIMNRYNQLVLSLDDLKQMEPAKVETAFYPKGNIQRKETPVPDFERYHDRMIQKGSMLNLFYLWLEYKQENLNGYQTTQFYEYLKPKDPTLLHFSFYPICKCPKSYCYLSLFHFLLLPSLLCVLFQIYKDFLCICSISRCGYRT